MRFVDADIRLQKPFANLNYPLDKMVYFGESLILKTFRGQGIGHRFFAARETFAKILNAKFCCFCAVDRPADHPLKPEGYHPLHQFWQRQGYSHQNHIVAYYPWQDVNQDVETQKPMSFWIKQISD